MTGARCGRLAARSWAAVWIAVVAGALALPAHAVGRDAADFLLPERARAFDVGGRLLLQGVPVDVAGFVAPQPPAVVAAWVKARWPAVHADDAVGHRRVLGRLAGDRYLTLQLETTPGGGTRGLWASAPVREALRAQAGPHAAVPSPMPAGSRPMVELSSVDGGVRADTSVARNRLDVVTNADHLVRRLQADGLALERRTPLPDAVGARVHGEWLQFAGEGRQAAALIHRDGAGETTVSLVRRTRTPETAR